MPPKLKLFLELLERGSLPHSRLRSALEDLRSPFSAGLLRQHGRGAGQAISVLNTEMFREWIKVKYPGAFEEIPATSPRVANLAMSRDTKRGRPGLDYFAVTVRAHAVTVELASQDQATMACIVEATRRFGAATLHLAVPGTGRMRLDPALPKGLRIMTVEGPTTFDQSESLLGEADLFLQGGTGGRMRDALIEWIARQEPGEVIHFGDFDPVGLQEFQKLAVRMPGLVRFHLPDGLEELFRGFSNRGLMEADNNRTIMASLKLGLHPSADRIMELIRIHGPLEQEAALVKTPSSPSRYRHISKSRFIDAHQCLLRLWNQVHRPELATPPDPETQARFDAGKEVGDVARRRFPGVLVEADHRHPEEALAETARLLADPSVQAIHEAAFLHEGALVRVDSLVRRGDRWDLVETKSVVQEKDIHVLDASFQRWVVAQAGLPVDRAYLMRLNREYVYESGELDLEQLFALEDVTDNALLMEGQIQSEFLQAVAVAADDDPPLVLPGKHCQKPYECPFKAHCTRDWPVVSNPVGWLPRIGEVTAMELGGQGIHSMFQIPLLDLSKTQLRVRECHEKGVPWINPGLLGALNQLSGTRHYLDFETYATPLPVLRQSRPYEAVPVQWSCHTVYSDGRMEHREFLADGLGDPRRPFIESLLEAVKDGGPIVVYSAFEATTLKKLAVALPDKAVAVQAVLDRLVDLLAIIKENVYLPAFQGSYSIKMVLPVLVPGFGYSELDVKDGLAAMAAFRRSVEETNPEERRRIKQNLLAYCGHDTIAMVKVHEALVSLTD